MILPVGLGCLAVPASASLNGGREALHDYARARLADSDGALAQSVQSYKRAFAVDPDSTILAMRSFRQAMEVGDRGLALRAATVLDREMALPPDGVLLLLSESIGKQDWARADALNKRLVSEHNFAFLAPIIESWMTLAQGKYAPAIMPRDKGVATLTRRYLAEHTALQLLALGDAKGAMPHVQQAVAMRTNQLPGFRMAAAARLVDLGGKEAALALLDIRNKDCVLLRKEIEAGRAKEQIFVRTAAQGFARLLFRLAEDLSGDGGRTLALSTARIATFADPSAEEYRVQLARELQNAGQPAFALKELALLKSNSSFASAANDVRIAAVLDSGDKDRALAMARQAVDAPGADAQDHIRLAGLLSRRDEHQAAADAYQKAMDIFGETPLPWTLHLLKGSALEQAGQWDKAMAELEKAAAIAPNEPVILNYLGYAQIERRQNVEEALGLIEKASGLRPDDAAITDSLGWAHYVNGDVMKAIPVLEKAVLGAPADATVNEHLGDAYWSAGRRFEARYSWKAAFVFADQAAQKRISRKIEFGLHPDVAAP